MLRLTWIEARSEPERLKVEGRIVGEWSDLIERELATRPAAGVELDLSEATYIDPRGIEILRRLSASGVRVVGDSPLIADILKSGGWQLARPSIWRMPRSRAPPPGTARRRSPP